MATPKEVELGQRLAAMQTQLNEKEQTEKELRKELEEKSKGEREARLKVDVVQKELKRAEEMYQILQSTLTGDNPPIPAEMLTRLTYLEAENAELKNEVATLTEKVTGLIADNAALLDAIAKKAEDLIRMQEEQVERGGAVGGGGQKSDLTSGIKAMAALTKGLTKDMWQSVKAGVSDKPEGPPKDIIENGVRRFNASEVALSFAELHKLVAPRMTPFAPSVPSSASATATLSMASSSTTPSAPAQQRSNVTDFGNSPSHHGTAAAPPTLSPKTKDSMDSSSFHSEPSLPPTASTVGTKSSQLKAKTMDWKADLGKQTSKALHWLKKGAKEAVGAEFTVVFKGKKYRCLKPVAEGSSSIVYICKDEQNNRFAMKKTEVASDSQFAALKREVELMDRLRHNNIVRCFGIDSAAKAEGCLEVLIMMELAEKNIGTIIAERAEQKKWFSEGDALKVLTEVISAVAHLHSQNPPIAHREVCALNVIMVDNRSLKLCHFSSATKFAFEPKGVRDIAMIEEEIESSTPMFARSPEMCNLHSKVRIDEKVDIWGLGCLLYHLCFLQMPFSDNKLQIINANYTIPSMPPVNPRVLALIKECLAVDPTQRPDVWTLADRVAKLRNVPINLPRPASVGRQPVHDFGMSPQQDPAPGAFAATSTETSPTFAPVPAQMNEKTPEPNAAPAARLSPQPVAAAKPAAAPQEEDLFAGFATPGKPPAAAPAAAAKPAAPAQAEPDLFGLPDAPKPASTAPSQPPQQRNLMSPNLFDLADGAPSAKLAAQPQPQRGLSPNLFDMADAPKPASSSSTLAPPASQPQRSLSPNFLDFAGTAPPPAASSTSKPAAPPADEPDLFNLPSAPKPNLTAPPPAAAGSRTKSPNLFDFGSPTKPPPGPAPAAKPAAAVGGKLDDLFF